MRFEELNKNNYLIFAIKFYDNPQSLTKEDFDNDLKRFKYVKRLLNRYKNTKNIEDLKVHLILNHLIVLFNVFNDAAVPLLFYNLDESHWSTIKSFLIFLNRLPEFPKTFINTIQEDENCLSLLRTI
jgi:hypothetical protein